MNQNLNNKPLLYRAHSVLEVEELGMIFQNPYLFSERRPRTMPHHLHEISGNWFQSQFGLNFRSKAIFCSGSLAQAVSYLDDKSTLIQIWPIGRYSLCFSERCTDLFEHLAFSFKGNSFSVNEVNLELANLGYVKYENSGLENAVASQCEVMLFAENFGFVVK